MLLALETAFNDCSVCLYDADTLIALKHEYAPRLQTQRLLPMLDDMLKENNVSLKDITTIAFNRGPASFSGVRINTAVAQALAFAHDIPCVPVSSLQAQAQAVFLKNDITAVTVVNDAKMKEVYVANFVKNEQGIAVLDGEEKLLPYSHDFAQSITTNTVVGDAVQADKLLITLPKEEIVILEEVALTAEHLAILAQYYMKQGASVDAVDAQPVYLRNNAWKTLIEQKAHKRSQL